MKIYKAVVTGRNQSDWFRATGALPHETPQIWGMDCSRGEYDERLFLKMRDNPYGTNRSTLPYTKWVMYRKRKVEIHKIRIYMKILMNFVNFHEILQTTWRQNFTKYFSNFVKIGQNSISLKYCWKFYESLVLAKGNLKIKLEIFANFAKFCLNWFILINAKNNCAKGNTGIIKVLKYFPNFAKSCPKFILF